MRNLYLPAAIVFVLGLSSCSYLSSVFADPEGPKYPDTLILATQGYKADVQFNWNDSLYTIIRYWTDDNGKWLYKLSEDPYKRGRLHGKRFIWNEWGDTLHFSIWDEGTPRDSMLEFYDNRPEQLKQIVYYRPNGNKDYEIFFYPNGKPRTDTIVYIQGLREGEINFYDSIPKNFKPTETYFYKNDHLIGVRIYKSLYDQLESRALGLRLQIARDSIAVAQQLALGDTAEIANKNVIQLNRAKNQDYKGNASTDVDADVW